MGLATVTMWESVIFEASVAHLIRACFSTLYKRHTSHRSYATSSWSCSVVDAARELRRTAL
jgi:hypothetical protein